MRKLRHLLLPARTEPAPASDSNPAERAGRGWWWDIAIAVLLGLAAALFAYRNGQDLNPVIYEWASCDSYFDADTPRVIQDMTGRLADHYRTRVHPLFPLIALPPEKVIEKGLGVNEVVAARLVTAVVAALWATGLFWLFRLIGCRRLDATLFGALALASAASMFWFIVPDTYPFASLSMLAALLVVAARSRGPVRSSVAVAVSAFTLAITITNFMAGLAMSVCAFPLRKAIGISLAAVIVVLLLWCVEKALMPSARFPLSDSEESNYVLLEQAGGPLRISAAFFLHTMVVPEPTVLTRSDPGLWVDMLSVQKVSPGAGGMLGLAAVVMWASLLVIGGLAMLAGAGDRRYGIMLALVLAGQLSLHLLYGAETFVYSLHFAPLLFGMSAMGALTRLRPIVLALAMATTVLAGVNNVRHLQQSKAFMDAPHEIGPDVPTTTNLST